MNMCEVCAAYEDLLFFPFFSVFKLIWNSFFALNKNIDYKKITNSVKNTVQNNIVRIN